MSELKVFKALLKAPKSDVAVLLTTFICTVVFDLVVAIGCGMVMTMFLFMKRISDTTQIKDLVAEEVFDDKISGVLEKLDDKVLVYQVKGPLFFGVVQELMERTKVLKPSTEVFILDLRHTISIDASAISALKQIYARCDSLNIKFILTHVNGQPKEVLTSMGLAEIIGEHNIYDSKVSAIKDAYEYIMM